MTEGIAPQPQARAVCADRQRDADGYAIGDGRRLKGRRDGAAMSIRIDFP